MLDANRFNVFFANVGKKTFEETRNDINLMNAESFNELNLNQPIFKPEPVDLATVVLTMKKLNETNAFGSDGISFKFIKDCLPVIVSYLLVIINTSIVTSTFLRLW